MFCSNCGKELPAGTSRCPACGFVTMGTAAPGPVRDTVDDLVAEAKRMTHELTDLAKKVSSRAVAGTEAAVKDPGGTARKAARKAADELEAAIKEVDRVLRQI